MTAINLSLTPVPKSAVTPESISALISLSLSFAATLPDISGVPLDTSSSAGPSSASAFPTQPKWSQYSAKKYPLGQKAEHFTKVYKEGATGEPWLARVTTTSAVGYEDVRTGLFEKKVETECVTVIGPKDENLIVDEREVGEYRVQGRYSRSITSLGEC
jgi:hypothetical protein